MYGDRNINGIGKNTSVTQSALLTVLQIDMHSKTKVVCHLSDWQFPLALRCHLCFICGYFSITVTTNVAFPLQTRKKFLFTVITHAVLFPLLSNQMCYDVENNQNVLMDCTALK